MLGALRYRDGTFERVAAPILICLAENDLEISAEFIRTKPARTAHAEIRVYPSGHFDKYHGDAFVQVVADQVAFPVRSPDCASSASPSGNAATEVAT